MGLLKSLWMWFFGPDLTCLYCSSPIQTREYLFHDVRNRLCQSCRDRLPFIPPPVCRFCGRSEESTSCTDCIPRLNHALEANRSVLRYTSLARDWIALFKYQGREELGKLMGFLMAEVMIREGWEYDWVTCVPLHSSRLKERGFNQSYLLAKEVSYWLRVPFLSCLERIRLTSSQSRLSRRERLHALSGAFRIPPSCSRIHLEGKRFLLVDDVYTTGATVSECAGILKESGAKKIVSLTFAR